MRIFKPKFRSREGKLQENKNWWVDFFWHRRRCRLPGFTSQKQTEAFGRRLEDLMSSLASGQTPDASLVKWMQAQSPSMQQKLAKYGLLDGRFAGAGKPLIKHLEEWKAVLLAKGNTPYHAERYFVDTQRILKLAKSTFHADLSPSRVQLALETLRAGDEEKTGLSLQTLNHALRAIKSFSNWMVSDRRATEDPLAFMKGFNVRTDRRHDRRALSDDEVTQLLNAVEKGEASVGISATDRAMLYRVALSTGFRRSELSSLKPSSFHLDRNPPTITIQAGYSKHRREDTQPIRPDLAAALTTWLKARPAEVQLWPNLNRSSRMIQDDLLAARTVWLKAVECDPEQFHERSESDFLAYRNRDNLVADFHALRHTFITGLVNSGASVKVAQDLARHSTPTLTLSRYAHLGLQDTSKALAALPAMPISVGSCSEQRGSVPMEDAESVERGKV